MIAGLDLLLTWLLRIGRAVAAAAIGLMVLVIILQVFFRYILNNALPWPDEAARFLMLWMTGLVAPSAYRWGGFVAIDMVREAMGRRVGLVFNLFILVLSLAVLVVTLQLGWKHINSGWLFNSSSLKIPLELIGLETLRVKLAWMYMSLPVGFALMTLVNIEMLLKTIHMLVDPQKEYGPISDQIIMSGE